jgi:cytochrome P450
MSDTTAAVEFDHHSREFAAHRDEIFEDLRKRCPVAHTNSYGGYWVATTYDTAREVLRNDKVFTVEKGEGGFGGIMIPAHQNPELIPGEVDGERHSRYRTIMNPYFSRATIEKLRPRVRQIAQTALDRIEESDDFDAVADYATVIPLETIFDYLGVEVGDRLRYLLEVEDAFATNGEHGGGRSGKGLFEKWIEWLDIVRVARDKEAGRGLIHDLGNLADHTLSDQELLSLMMSSVMGGVRTTAAAIAHGVWYLDQDRDLRARLIAQPELVPRAAEEIMRCFSPAAGVARTATADVELGPVTLGAGERVLASIHSGNHDEAVYPDPYQVDLDRHPQQSLVFGSGPHLCLGIWLSRLELDVAVTELLARFPDYEIERERVHRWEDLGVLHVWTTMPARANLAS